MLTQTLAENERFPTELGWSLRPEIVGPQAILRLSDMIRAAGILITDAPANGPEHTRRDGHFIF